MEGAKFSANAGRKGEDGSMSFPLIPRIHKEKEKRSKKERETAAAIFNQKVTFLSCTEGDISILR